MPASPSAHTLRYYEKMGLLLHIQRDARGYRDYAEKDLVWIGMIKRLKATDMPLAEIRRFARLRAGGDSTIPDRLEILYHHQKRVEGQIADLVRHQEKIAEKIELCKKGGSLPIPKESP